MREHLIALLKRPWAGGLDPLVRRAVMELARRRSPGHTPARAVLDNFYQRGGSERPLLLGHRGAMARAPENTLGAFRAALDDGGDGVELDVQLSADAVPMVLHDDTLDRTTSGSGLPVRHEAIELEALDAASWFGGWPQAEHVPRLVDVLDRMPDGAVVNVELKGPTPLSLGLERRTMDVVAAHTGRLGIIVSSFHPAQLLVARQLAPHVPIGLLISADNLMPLRTAWAAPLLLPDALHPPSAVVDAALVDAAHDAGMRVHVWAVGGAPDAQRLLDLGVDGLIVDDVAEAAEVFGQRYRSFSLSSAKSRASAG